MPKHARRSARWVALALIAVVPVAVLGTVVGALAASSSGTAKVQAAIVNQDKLVKKTTDGKTSYVAAGRLVVTELQKQSETVTAVNWQLLDAETAKKDLRNGSISAYLTIPSDFSKSLSTVGTTDATQARLSITTDQAHGYLVSELTPTLGTALSASLGQTTATSVIEGLYSGYGSIADGYAKSASGASQLADGIGALASGLSQLGDGQSALASGLSQAASGASASASGASKLADGVSQYTGGVDTLAAGLQDAATQSSGLQQFPAGVSQYTGGVSAISSGINAILNNQNLSDAQKVALLTTAQQGQSASLQDSLTALAAGGSQLDTGAQGAASLQSGVAKIAAGATQLSAGSPALRSGTSDLATGLGKLATGLSASAAGAEKLASGTTDSASGATKLQDGVGNLATGLQQGADKTPKLSTDQASNVAKVAVTPAVTSAKLINQLGGLAQAVSSLMLPTAIWLGAGATVLLLGALRRGGMLGAASSGRLLGEGFLRGGALVLAQSVLLLVLLEFTAPVPIGALPAVIGVTLLAAACFLAVHQLLTVLFGSKIGSVVSILLMIVQLAASGTLLPIGLVSTPFQVLNPWLPVPAAATAIQSIIAGSNAGVGAALALIVGVGLAAFGVAVAVTARRRGSASYFARLAAPIPAD